uniref:Uncharacterized protein n=1 Tax=Anopheles atroparvus TaxID=41427 RepID=A0A182ISD7_ANOAO
MIPTADKTYRYHSFASVAFSASCRWFLARSGTGYCEQRASRKSELKLHPGEDRDEPPQSVKWKIPRWKDNALGIRAARFQSIIVDSFPWSLLELAAVRPTKQTKEPGRGNKND